ncbi:MAG: type II toxin-antitoxin system HicB family antitoxin [Firmicutes bacterium]|nr:type II toxin-antitoxin system HicB family antitoxin [Bacillota bacterium]
MKNYPVIIEQDGKGYVVSCPVFKGCYFQGETIDEALKNIKEAIRIVYR